MSLWNVKDWAGAYEAGREFVLHHRDDGRVEDVYGQSLQVGLQALHGQDSPTSAASRVTVSQFLGYLRDVNRESPELLDDEELRWYRGHAMLLAGQYQQALDTLNAIGPDSPFYEQSLCGLALAHYKQAVIVDMLGANAQEQDPR